MSKLTNFSKYQKEEKKISLELREEYKIHKKNEPEIIEPINYKISLSQFRPQIINWIIFLCENLNFSIETLFRTIIIFEQYIGKVKNENFNQNNFQLIIIGSLSLATKIEEINCNYIKFFTDNVLNSPNNKNYTYKDLTKMEFEILTTLKFKILYSTPINFGKIYFELLKKKFQKNNFFLFNFWKDFEINLKSISFYDMYITMSQSDIAYYSLIQTCNQYRINDNVFKKIYNIINYGENEEEKIYIGNNKYNRFSIRSL
jgi:hypothetical protein